MQVIEHSIDLSNSRKAFIEIFPMADMHIGAKAFALQKFVDDVEYIKETPNAYWFSPGDITDSIVYQDLKRFSPKTIDPMFAHCMDNLPVKQCDFFCKLVEPIKHKCLGILRGNHENAILKNHSFDQTSYIAEKLGVPNLQDSCFIILRIAQGTSRSLYTIYSTHGNVAGRKSGGKANRLEDVMGNFEADIYVIGHGHKKLIHTSSRLYTKRIKNKWVLKSNKRLGIMTGSYLKSYNMDEGGYAEAMMMPPSDIGCVKIVITPRGAETIYCDEIKAVL